MPLPRVLHALDAAVRQTSPAFLFWAVVVVDLALMGLVLATVLLPREARISLDASTERLEINVPAGATFPSWGALNATQAGPAGEPAGGCQNAKLQFDEQLAGPFRIVATSKGDGGMTIELLGRTGSPFGTLSCPDGINRPAPNDMVLQFAPDRARMVSLPFRGQLTLGDAVRSGMNDQKLLRGGVIVVEASSAPFRNGRVAAETRLYLGDSVTLMRALGSSKEALSHGVIRMGPDGALTLVAHATAAEARVLHMGQARTSATSVAPSFWAKLQAQPEWTLLVAVGALLLNLLAALRSYLKDLNAKPVPRRLRANR